MKFLVALLLLASAACAQDQAEASRLAAGCGANSVQFEVKTDNQQHPVAQPEAGRAIVYVFRDEWIDNVALTIGGGPTTRAGVDGTWVGANSTKSYFSFALEPGDHRLCTERQSRFKSQLAIFAAASFSAEPGEAYYFHTITPERPFKGETVRPVPIDPAQAQLMISVFAHSTFTIK